MDGRNRQTNLQLYQPIFKGSVITLELQSDAELPLDLLKKLEVFVIDKKYAEVAGDVKFAGDIDFAGDFVPGWPSIISFTPSICMKRWTGILGEEYSSYTKLTFVLKTTDSSGKSVKVTKDIDLQPNIQAVNLAEELSFSVLITKKTQIDMEIRDDHSLCSEEDVFFSRRKDFVFTKMKKYFGEDVISRQEDVPNIAIIGSGGGMRAAVGMGAALQALTDEFVFDFSMYTAALSGSAWYLTTLYSFGDKVNPKEVNGHIRKKLEKNYGTYPTMAWKTMRYFMRGFIVGQSTNLTVTNYFGNVIGRFLLDETCKRKWSEQTQKVNDGSSPLPLIAALHVHHDKTLKYHHEWIDITPYRVCLPGYGVSIKMKDFGNQFYGGFSRNQDNELPIHYLQGICGSAYAIVRDFRPQGSIDFCSMKLFLGSRFYQSRIWSWFNRFDNNFVAKVPNCLYRISEIEELPKIINTQTGTHKKSTESQGTHKKSTESQGGVLYKGFSVLTEALICGINLVNFIMFESNIGNVRDVEKVPTMMLMDAGIAFNSPYPAVLHPSRKIDVILSFDFSNRYKDGNLPFQELRKAAAWAESRGVNFPPLDPQLKHWEEKWKDGYRKEVYVFSGSPTIVHFVLINKSFRSTGDTTHDFDIFSRFGTFKFRYSNKDFDRLNKLVQHNVKENMDVIIKCIRNKICRKQLNNSRNARFVRRLRMFATLLKNNKLSKRLYELIIYK